MSDPVRGVPVANIARRQAKEQLEVLRLRVDELQLFVDAEQWSDLVGWAKIIIDEAVKLHEASVQLVVVQKLEDGRFTLPERKEPTPCRTDCVHYVDPCAGADSCGELGNPCSYESSSKRKGV